MPPPNGAPGITWPQIALIVILVVAILAGGLVYYQSQKQEVTDQVTGDLTSIGSLKVMEIESWRYERLSDVRIISQNQIFRGALRGYLQNPDPEKTADPYHVLGLDQRHIQQPEYPVH